MKALKIVLEVLAALAAIAGVVYVIATYGDKIVAWARRLLGRDCDCLCQCDCEGDCDDCDCEGDCEDCDCCDCECCDDSDLVCDEDLIPDPAVEEPAEVPTEEATEADFEG